MNARDSTTIGDVCQEVTRKVLPLRRVPGGGGYLDECRGWGGGGYNIGKNSTFSKI